MGIRPCQWEDGTREEEVDDVRVTRGHILSPRADEREEQGKHRRGTTPRAHWGQLGLERKGGECTHRRTARLMGSARGRAPFVPGLEDHGTLLVPSLMEVAQALHIC